MNGSTTVNGNFSYTGSGTLVFGTVSTASTVTGTFNHTGTTATINGGNTFNGTATFSSGANTVTISHTGNRFNKTVEFNNTGLTTISGGDNRFGTTTPSSNYLKAEGALTLNGNSNQFNGTATTSCAVGSITVATACVAGAATVSGASNTFAGSLGVKGTSDLIFTASTGDTNTFSSTTTVGGELTLNAGADGNTFMGNLDVRGTGASIISQGNTFQGTMAFAGPVNINDDTNSFGNGAGDTLVISAGDLVFTATDADSNTFAGNVTLSSTSSEITMNSGANTNTFSGTLTVSGTGASTISAGNIFSSAVSFAGTTTVGGHGASPSATDCTGSALDNTFSSTFATSGSGDDLVINGSCNTFTGAVTLGGELTMNTNMNRNQFNATPTALTVSGTGNSSITAFNNFGSGTAGSVSFPSVTIGDTTIQGSNTFRGPFSYTSTSGSLSIQASGNTFSNTFDFTTGSGDLSFTGGTNKISGATTLTFSDAGFLSIGGANTFTGLFKVDGSSLGSSSFSGANTFNGGFTFTGTNGGTLTFNDDNTFANLTIESPTSGQKSVKFEVNKTQTVTGRFKATGPPACLGATTCTSLSMSNGNPVTDHWFINVGIEDAADVGFLKVSNSDAGGAAAPITCNAITENCVVTVSTDWD